MGSAQTRCRDNRADLYRLLGTVTMTTLAQRLLARWYSGIPHPYALFERKVTALLEAALGQTLLAYTLLPEPTQELLNW